MHTCNELIVLFAEFITDHMGGQQFTAIVVMMSILYIMAAVFGLKYGKYFTQIHKGSFNVKTIVFHYIN